MDIRIFQKGFNYAQDGTGNRLVLHLQGCNMHCPWCSNPEGMPLNGVLLTEKEWLDESCCPKGAVKDGVLDRGICASCLEKPCVNRYRQKGIRLSCQEYSTEELLQECEAASRSPAVRSAYSLRRSKNFYRDWALAASTEPLNATEAIRRWKRSSPMWSSGSWM